jgi:hypothetical protein
VQSLHRRIGPLVDGGRPTLTVSAPASRITRPGATSKFPNRCRGIDHFGWLTTPGEHEVERYSRTRVDGMNVEAAACGAWTEHYDRHLFARIRHKDEFVGGVELAGTRARRLPAQLR